MKKKTKKCVRVQYIGNGDNLQDLLDRLKKEGVMDLTKVHVTMQYVGCTCSGDDYCYCPTAYADIGLEYTKEE